MYGELNQWESAQPEAQRCDWLTACKFQNNVALWKRGSEWKPPSCLISAVSSWLWAWPTDELRLLQYTSSSSFRANLGSSVNSFNPTCNISYQNFLLSLNGLKELLNIFQRVVKSTINGSQSSVFHVCTVGFSLSYILVRLVYWLDLESYYNFTYFTQLLFSSS